MNVFVTALVLAAALLLAGCQPTGDTGSSPGVSAAPGRSAAAAPSTAASNALQLVALGDSETTGSGDRTGRGWVEYYAERIREGTGREVNVTNLARNGTRSLDLVMAVQQAADIRNAIAAADIVVLGIGGADLNAGDALLEAGSCGGTDCYDASIAAYGANIDAIAAEIVNLRGGQPTALRAITQPNALTGAESVIPPFLRSISTEVGVHVARGFNAATCAAMAAHDGACVDVLTAINGPDGTGDGYATGLMNIADCCYPSERGHRLIADLLYKTGLEPLANP
ncbi:MAG TPA: GDSL-type esterase/lipase family protein [Candidatus Limnocylindrales bacterium]